MTQRKLCMNATIAHGIKLQSLISQCHRLSLRRLHYFLHLDNISLFQVWQQFFTEDMIEYIVQNTHLYVNRDCSHLTIGVTGIVKFLCLWGYSSLGVILCHRRVTTGLYNQTWVVPAVHNVMTKNCCVEIRKYLHLADKQNLQAEDKLRKVSHMYKLLNNQLIQYEVFNELLSIYESI